jgi:hypothetical protein
LSIDWILSRFDDGPARAIQAYRQFTGQGRGIRVWDDLRGGSLLGTEAFIEKLKPHLKTRATSIEVPRKERLAGRPSLDELFANVEDKMSRNEQIYQAVRVYEYKLKEVSDFLGLYYSTISVIAKRVAQVKQTPRMKTGPPRFPVPL